MSIRRLLPIPVLLLSGVCAVASESAPIVEKESDNPWIWNGVHDALRAAEVQLEVKEIEPLPRYSIFTVEVRFEDCEPPLNRAHVTFNGYRWTIKKGTEVLCGRPADAGWQTYRNEKYGYEIRYPSDFEAWPTGPAGDRDGRALRIGRKEHAAAVPMLDIRMHAEVPAVESPNMDVTVGYVEINGVKARELTYRWNVNGDVAWVVLHLRDATLEFQAQPGLRDVRETVWWKIISTFRFQPAD